MDLSIFLLETEIYEMYKTNLIEVKSNNKNFLIFFSHIKILLEKVSYK